MAKIRWDKIVEICSNCGEKAEYIFCKKSFFHFQEIIYCKSCLLKRVKIEKQIKGVNLEKWKMRTI